MCARTLRVLASLLFCLLALGAAPAAGTNANGRFSLTPAAIGSSGYVIAGGGGASSGGVYSLRGTIGQPVTGISTGGTYRLSAGFWSGPVWRSLYLPLISR
ncbi:MAG: hypothetical protein RMK99_03890 [Anaerolineales bacterium]|nr:hypothetical protein [Anaerolineales bacterium]